MDKGRRKRIADLTEKLGIGFMLGVVAQGIFAKDLSPRIYALGIIALATAVCLLAISVFLSKEE